MGEVWDIGKSTKKGIILNSHARTGLYKSWQIIVDNYIKQDNAWNDYRKEKGLSLDPSPWQGYKDGVEEIHPIFSLYITSKCLNRNDTKELRLLFS